MRNAIEWIKTNPIFTVAGIVSLLGIVVIVYFYVVSAPAFSAEKTDMLKKEKQRQDQLLDIPVPLPNEDPNAPADIHNVVVNQIVINEVDQIYREIQTQYDQILASARNKNSQNHAPVLLGGNAIWPDKDPAQFFDLYVRAASDYKDHFKAVFDKQSNANNWNMPHMIASSPPTQAELQLLLAQSAFDYISSVGAQSASDLSQDQADKLFAEQRMELMKALNNRARSIHLYTQLPPEEDPFAPKEPETGSDSPTPGAGTSSPFGDLGGPATGTSDKTTAAYPFRIEQWAFAAEPPTPDQLWEGQVQLWIMRDIMWTIHAFNNVGKTVKALGPDGSIRDEPASVVNSPIKRLLKLQTLPGYVGLHNTGAALGGVADTEFGSTEFSSPTAPALGSPLGDGFGEQPGSQMPSIYPTPPSELAPKAVTERAPEHFGITPTGRISNSVFDVRHTQLTIHIEASKVPAFFESLRATNFMTIVKAEITDVDEYELLREGFVYGHTDIVEADLVIESLWFRNWTEELMPKIVKEKLLIIQPEGGLSPEEQQPF